VNRFAIATFLAVLSAVSLAYFGTVTWQAPSLARELLHRGYEARGWTEQRLTLRLRMIGVLGAVLSAVAFGVACVRIAG
jgi:hypothetical protein